MLAGPGNLAAIVGFVWAGIWGWRRHVMPVWAALLLVLGGLTAVLLSEFGTGLLIGCFWV